MQVTALPHKSAVLKLSFTYTYKLFNDVLFLSVQPKMTEQCKFFLPLSGINATEYANAFTDLYLYL